MRTTMPSWRRTLTVVLPLVIAATIGVETPGFAAPPKKIAKPKAVASVPGRYVVPSGTTGDPTADKNMRSAKAVRWPTAATAEVRLPVASDPGPMVQADAVDLAPVTGMPVSVGSTAQSGKRTALAGGGGSPASVRVEVLDPAAGKAGKANRSVVTRITRTDGVSSGGAVRVALDYSGFRDAVGGDWSNRLRLVQLPECALENPDAPQCQATALPTVNDPATGKLTTTVSLTSVAPAKTAAGASTMSAAAASGSAGAVVALASSPQSSTGGGDYAATPLKATSSWSGGGQSGDFTWSYPIEVPTALGGPSAQVGLSYSAQSMDGKTAATNNQPSWIGDGFDYAAGAVSRVYPACVDDGKTGIGDLCWGTDNATLTLPGHAGELIQVSTSPDVWKIKEDDGSKVERLTGATNGARNGEYWKVTTTDGWEYYFGLNQLPGWSSGKSTTQSVYTVPVFGNNAGEPCYNATFANASCDQAYTWNLDYVVDPHGNSMSLWYAQQLNHYARNVTNSAVSTYVRAGHLDHIDYGTRRDSNVDSIYSVGAAPARVEFGLQDRCVTQGATCVKSTPSNWPDVPWDQQCDSTTSCPDVYTPAFFTQKMLSTITTKVWTGTGTTYRDVRRWTLNHQFKDPGDGHAKTLWLSGISAAGLAATPNLTTPDVTFASVQLSNRVDTAVTKDPIIRFRVSSITNEAGGVTAVTYSSPECVKNTNMPAAADTNTKRCYPVWWTPYGGTTATFDWFHKYVVTGVTASDPTGLAPAEVTSYSYDTPAWHYDDNEIVTPNHKSWGQWRGYSKVRTLHGASGTNQEQTDTIYFRGMHGDKLSTGTRTVTIPADATFGGAAINDEDWRRGLTREVIQYNGVGDNAPVVSKSLTEPWESGPTATRTRNSVTVNAYITNTKSSTTKTALDGNRGWLTAKSTNTFDTETGLADPIGRIMKVDETNDDTSANDNRCTINTFATDPNGKIRTVVAQQRKLAVSCSATPNLATDLISDVRTWYDYATSFNSTVTKGDVTRTERLADVVAGAATYINSAEATYDVYGRTLTSKDVLGNVTTTAYTPTTGSLPTSMTSTAANGWVSTVYSDPAYGNPTAKVDPNNRRTDLEYDAFGRLTKVWEPGRAKATQTPNLKYTYVMGGTTGATSVASSKLNPAGTGYNTTYQVFDSQLRPRQTQVPAPGGGVILSDTIYDSRGLTVQTNNAYFQAGVSWGSLFVPSSPVPGRMLATYDNARRQIASIFQKNGVEQWRTTTAHGGDYSDVTAPPGGVGTTTYVNATGQATKIINYHSNVPSADKLSTANRAITTYEYDKRGYPSKIIDPMGSIWTYEYDVRGRMKLSNDPDRGQTTYTYDDADRQVTVTDSRPVTRTTVYDQLSRPTERWQGAAGTGTLLARTTYDSLAKGMADTSTRYVGGATGAQYTSSVLGYDAAGRVTSAAVTIPSTEGLLAGTYTTNTTYNADGSVNTVQLPAIGGTALGAQPAETLTYGYDSMGLPTTLSGANTYLTNSAYDSLARLSATLNNDGGSKNLAQIYAYEDGTGRLLEHGVYDNDTSNVYQDAYYEYDTIGNVTGIKDLTNQYGAGPDDNQCFRYDYFRRLVHAWTPANGACGTTDPTNPTLGGPAPYWQSWTYDEVGNRKTQVDHVSGGTTTATSTIPAPTAAHPHSLSKVDYAGVGGAKTNTYAYDNAGNMTTRAVAGKPSQTLHWDAEGHLDSVTDTSGASATYVYDVDGSRLISRDSTGATLYIGSQQLHLSTSNVVSTTRFYGATAFRTSGEGLCWTASDPHGTSTLSFKAATLTKTQRRMTPFGQSRGTAATWPTNLGFVGGTDDPTGLTQLGARPYDASIGRFVAIDPIFTSTDPQTFNGYSYAHNSPINAADSSGLKDDFYLYVGTTVERWTKGNYRYTRIIDWYVGCSFDGWCNIGVFYGELVAFFRTYVPPAGVPYVPPAVYKAQAAIPRCPSIITPPPPPSCFVLDLKCAFKDPGAWWRTNGKPLAVGASVIGLGTCLWSLGLGCALAGGAASTLSMTDRTYDFVQNKEYNDGFWANAKYGGGMALDTLGFLPGLGLARGFASSDRAASAAGRGAGASGASEAAFVETTNAAGGKVWLSTIDDIKQVHFQHIVDGNRGANIHILTGVHGNEQGAWWAEYMFYSQDAARWGSRPGVRLYDMSVMGDDEITAVLRKPDLVIGAFCFSRNCLTDLM
ncbi:RHS repeat-associated core domain-containing protein [Dactylosporangium sp. NPDC049742]|uniref:RHS repeat-associated core domain-containing protein n=1 Tax=Dactylosporangium sp. NPDC049742 TaxID=3154737 RepID=UPI003447682B